MANTFKVRSYIRAKSPKRLRSLMYEKQKELGFISINFDMVFDGTYHYAWYYELIDTMEKLKEVSANDDKTD